MAQPLMNYTLYGTSTGAGPVIIRSGPGAFGVASINQIGSTNAIVTILDATSTTAAAGRTIANITPGSLGTFAYFVPLVNGLTICSSTSSTAEITFTWA